MENRLEDKYKLSAEDLKRIEERAEEIRREIYPTLIKPIEESRRLTAADYAITINSPPIEYNP